MQILFCGLLILKAISTCIRLVLSQEFLTVLFVMVEKLTNIKCKLHSTSSAWDKLCRSRCFLISCLSLLAYPVPTLSTSGFHPQQTAAARHPSWWSSDYRTCVAAGCFNSLFLFGFVLVLKSSKTCSVCFRTKHSKSGHLIAWFFLLYQ